jgi:hypothetical protein
MYKLSYNILGGCSRAETKHGRHILLSSGKICILVCAFFLQKKTKQWLFIATIVPPTRFSDDNRVSMVQHASLQFHVQYRN